MMGTYTDAAGNRGILLMHPWTQVTINVACVACDKSVRVHIADLESIVKDKYWYYYKGLEGRRYFAACSEACYAARDKRRA